MLHFSLILFHQYGLFKGKWKENYELTEGKNIPRGKAEVEDNETLLCKSLGIRKNSKKNKIFQNCAIGEV